MCIILNHIGLPKRWIYIIAMPFGNNSKCYVTVLNPKSLFCKSLYKNQDFHQYLRHRYNTIFQKLLGTSHCTPLSYGYFSNINKNYMVIHTSGYRPGLGYLCTTTNYHSSSYSTDSNKNSEGKSSLKENEETDQTLKKEKTDVDESKLGLVQKFKLMYKQYWYVLIPVHLVTSIFWFGGFFFAAKSGFEIIPFLEHLGTPDKILAYLRDSNAGYYGIAYAMYKLATPARYTVTLGGTTIAINYLKNRSYIKPVPTKDELKMLYEEKKEELKDRTSEMKDKYQEKKGELVEKYYDRSSEMKEKYQEKKDELLEKYYDRREEIMEKYEEKKGEIWGKYQDQSAELKEKYQEKKEDVFRKLHDKSQDVKKDGS